MTSLITVAILLAAVYSAFGTGPSGVEETCSSCQRFDKIDEMLARLDSRLDSLQETQDTLMNKYGNKKQGKDCAELFKNGERLDGVYLVYPSDKRGSVEVYCDMTTDGGGWTVFQKRLDGSVDFYRGWADYKAGFGNLNGEFWLGNDFINRLSNQEKQQLRVDLEDTSGTQVYALYDMFAITSEATKYQLSLGTYSGNAGDSLTYSMGMPFSTKDKDNDSYPDNCAVLFKGAWWYKTCHNSNLNGLYHHGAHTSFADGVNWHKFKGHHYSMKRTEMKFRPVGFKASK